MKKKSKKTKTRILKTASSIIAKKGLNGITIRELSVAAKVNIAAVNYYFDSKEKLLEETVMYLASLIDKSFDILEDKEIAPQERLKRCLKDYAKQMCKNRGYITTIISHLSNKYPLSDYITDNVSKQHDKVLDICKEIFPDMSLEYVKRRTLQLMSAVNYPMLIGNFCYEIYDFKFCNDNDRNLFIDSLVDEWTNSK